MKTGKLISLNLKDPRITAASSLLSINNRLFLCCDDQYCLFELTDQLTDKLTPQSTPHWTQHVWPEAPELPKEHGARKKVKPDFEVLVQSASDPNCILMLPSGSRPNRTLALKFDLAANTFSPLDLSAAFQQWQSLVGPLNIEGATLYSNKFLLLNRGVGDIPSSIIFVDGDSFIATGKACVDFGSIDGVSLQGSELCFFGGRLYALAVAEDAANSFDDGRILGSRLVELSLTDFSVLEQWSFSQAVKLEGLCRYGLQSGPQSNASSNTLAPDPWLVVTDPDGAGLSEFFQVFSS